MALPAQTQGPKLPHARLAHWPTPGPGLSPITIGLKIEFLYWLDRIQPAGLGAPNWNLALGEIGRDSGRIGTCTPRWRIFVFVSPLQKVMLGYIRGLLVLR